MFDLKFSITPMNLRASVALVALVSLASATSCAKKSGGNGSPPAGNLTASSMTESPSTLPAASPSASPSASPTPTPSESASPADSTGPSCSITSGPTGWQKNTSESFVFSCSDPSSVSSVECKLDDGAWAACTTTTGHTFSGLSNGAHSFSLRAIDGLLNTSSAVTQSWNTDVTLPSVTITSAPGSLINTTSVTISFTATDNIGGSGVSTLECKLDTASWSACSSPTALSSLADGAHVFAIRATDTAGNISDSQSTSWTVDTSAPNPPTVTGTSPTASTSPAWTWTSGGGNGNYRYKLDSSDLTTGSTTTTTASFTPGTALAEGSHTLYVQESNEAGNWSSVGSKTIVIDITGPACSITSGPTGWNKDTSESFVFSCSDSQSISSYECKLDAGSWAACNSSTGHALSGLTNGAHTFSVRATDNLSNVGTAASQSWNTDVTGPSVSITSAPASTVNTANSSFSFSTSDNEGGSGVASAECKLDTAEWASCTSPAALTGTADGAHVFYIRATDTAGNVSTTQSASWTIDTSAPNAPTVTGTSPNASATPTWSWSTGGGNGSYRYKLDSNDFTSGSTETTATSFTPGASLAEGTHTLYVQERDDAGNWSTSGSKAIALDLTGPSCSITSGPTGWRKNVSESVVFACTDSNSVAAYECKVDTGSWTTCDSATGHLAGSLAAGAHTFSLRATDNVANVGSTVSQSWNTDLTNPSASITSAPASLVNSSSSSFSFTNSDTGGSDVSSIECKLDTGDWTACTSPASYTGTADGAHTFYLRVTDGAGNLSETQSASWTIDTGAPNAPTVTGTTPTVDTTPTWSWSTGGNAGNGTYRYKLDSNDFGSGSTETTTASFTPGSALAEGTHTLYVQERDDAGNWSSSGSKAIAVVSSNGPICSITSGPSGWNKEASESFVFSCSDAVSYECKLDTGSWTACDSSTGQTFTSLANGAHTFYLRATDSLSVTGSTVSQSWNTDLTQPTASITSAPGTLVNSANSSFSFSTSDTGGSGVATIECHLDAAAWGACTSPTSFSGTADGEHTFYVRVTDTAGNVSATQSASWTIDTSAPNAPSVTGTSPVASSTPTWSWSTGGNAGNGTYRYKLDSNDFSSGSTETTSTSFTPGSALTETAHTLYVQERDNAGNWSPSGSKAITIDVSGPSCTISSGPTGWRKNSEESFFFSCTDSGTVSAYECKLDTGSWAACGSSTGHTFSSLANGAHTFSLRATDSLSNTGSTVSQNWSTDVTVPTVSITSAPAADVNTTTASLSFTASDNEGGSAISSTECHLDTASWAVCTSPASYSSLAEGAHTFYVRATDTAGNVSTVQTAAWTIDTVGPNAPTVTGTSPTASTTPTWSWSTGGNGGNGTYRIKLDSNDFSSGSTETTLTTYTPGTALAEGTHTLYVQERDAAGNWSTSGSKAITIDLTGPSCSITSGPSGWRKNTSESFVFSCSDPSTVSTYECKLDSGSWATCDSSTGHALSGITEASHTFSVRGTDSLGNVGTAATQSWNTDLTLPTASITSAPASLVNTANSSFSFSGTDVLSGVASVECHLDTAEWGACTSPTSYTGTADGAHTFYVRVTDNAGNQSTVTTASWTIDTIAPNAPTVTGTSPNASATPTWSWTTGGNGGSGNYRYKLDNSDLTSGSTGTTSTSYVPGSALSEGTHTLYVQERDDAGNWSTSGSKGILIDLTGPTSSITSTPTDNTLSTTAIFSFSANDGTGSGVASYQCQMDAGTWTACTSPHTYTLLGRKTHTLAVRAIDNVGNTGGAQTYTWMIQNTLTSSSLHTCAITDATGGKCWGENSFGQIGNNPKKTDPILIPTAVSGLTDIVRMAANGRYLSGTPEVAHTCAILSDGAVKCWGNNDYGQVGDGTSTQRIIATQVSGLTAGSGAVEIAAGRYHSCALLANNTIKCWGENAFGRLGDGTSTLRTSPVTVSGLTGTISSIAAGGAMTCAIMSTGALKCWGQNAYGQVGDGTTTQGLSPVNVSGLSSGVAQVAPGGFHTCALLTSGAVKCWGANTHGQIGDGTTTEVHYPVDVSGISSGAVFIATSEYTSCAVMSNGTIKCWGINNYGQLGSGVSSTYQATPVTVTTISTAKRVSAGVFHSCAYLSDGMIKCWGVNATGHLGNNSTATSLIPVSTTWP